MSTMEILKSRKEEIAALARKHGAYNIRVFGSAVRGEETPDSDIDFLVDMEQGRTLLDHSGLILDLQDLLGCKVDVVTERSLYWILRRKVVREAQLL